MRVVFPAMRPINIVVVVITIIEALRAFDIVYVFNKGTNGLELLSSLIIQNLKGEGLDIGVGAAIATVLLVMSLVPITIYLRPRVQEGLRTVSCCVNAAASASQTKIVGAR